MPSGEAFPPARSESRSKSRRALQRHLALTPVLPSAPMGTPEIALGICEFVVLLFALSLHEAAHGWMASGLGHQTARMLGPITLNPIHHIDPVLPIILPLVARAPTFPSLPAPHPTPLHTPHSP